MALISIRNLSLGYGGTALLDDINLDIAPGERICVLGRNGTGKTTLLKLICGDLKPDSGRVITAGPVSMARLPQEVPPQLKGSVYAVTATGLGEIGQFLAEYRRLSKTGGDARRLAALESHLNQTDGWGGEQSILQTLTRLDLDPFAVFTDLSAGLKRRVLLARALVSAPRVLLLDEPTNHLDIAAIDLLETELARFAGTLIFITHDRVFLKKFAGRIVEIDRGRAVSFACDHSTYLQRKAEQLEAESARMAVFDKKLAKEETWLRQGLKARRTRNMGRVRALEKLREMRTARRQRSGSVNMQIQDASRSGKLVIAADHIGFRWQAHPVVQDFSCMIVRGDKVGIIGPNGTGKTTLLKLLLGELAPEQGKIRHGTRLSVAYFDQLRAQLDPDRSVVDNLADGKDRIVVGDRTRHVIGYLQDFLFTPDRARSPVRILSGGERNRLLLARLFSRPSNVLVLDEPTNDLDMETMELLEERLIDYAGTLLLVSHDRAFLNNVVTSTLVLDGSGAVAEFVGGYDDWIRQRDRSAPVEKKVKKRPKAKPRVKGEQKKLGFNEKRELEALPRKIEALEGRQKELYQQMSDPLFYQKGGAFIAGVKDDLERTEEQIETAYQRWEFLESIG